MHKIQYLAQLAENETAIAAVRGKIAYLSSRYLNVWPLPDRIAATLNDANDELDALEVQHAAILAEGYGPRRRPSAETVRLVALNMD